MRFWIITLAVVMAWPALAQVESREGIALQNQILELRREVQSLRDAVARGGGAAAGGSLLGGSQRPSQPPGGSAGDLTASLVDRVQQLEEEVRRLRGRSDETGFALQRATEEQQKALGDMNFRLQELEGRGGAGSRPAQPSQGAATPPARPATPPAQGAAPAQATRTPEAALREGNAALARRDYAAAEKAAREVLARGQSPRAYDARFLLAEALFGKRDYQQAALTYDDTFRRSRNGSKAQDSLLGLANSFTALNEKRSACDTLNELRSQFPTPRADLRERIAQARQRAGCR